MASPNMALATVSGGASTISSGSPGFANATYTSTWKGSSVSYWDYPFLWIAFSILAGVIFYSRFYLQWIVSEIKRESIVPPFFWYQSIVGSLMLMVWSIYDQSPLGALSQSLNVVPYSRNVVHI